MSISPRPAASMQAIVSRPGEGGSVQTETPLQAVEDRLLQSGRHPDGADALHVGVAADRHQAGVRPADHAAQQREVDDRLHVVDAVHVMRDAHRPAEDDVLCRDVHVGDTGDRLARSTPGGRLDRAPVVVSTRARNAAKPSVCCVDEAEVTSAAFDHQLGDAGQQREVAADVRLHVEAGDLRSRTAGCGGRWARGS